LGRNEEHWIEKELNKKMGKEERLRRVE